MVSEIILTLLFIGMLTFAFNIQLVKAEPYQLPTIIWSKTYGGGGYDCASSVVQTMDGGYALLGTTDSFGAGDSDVWLVKTDANGNIQWNKTYGGPARDLGSSIVQTTDGGLILACSTMSFGAGSWDIWLIKVDALGNMQWNKTFGGTDFDVVEGERTITQTSDGGYAIAGFTLSFGTDTLWLIKTDQNGNVQWSKTYGPWWGAESIVQTSDGGYAMGGFDEDDLLLVKTDSTGNMQWYTTYGGSNCDSARSLVQTVDGGYALAGQTCSFGAGNYDVWLVKTDANGNVQWSKTYGGESLEWGNSLVQTSDGGYAIACPLGDFWLIKTDCNGNMQWNMGSLEPGLGLGWSVIITVNGEYVVAGIAENDFWLTKLAGLRVLTAKVNIYPEELNLISRGRWITAYIELPESYDIANINVSTILLNNTVSAELSLSAIGDYDEDGIPDLMVKFNRSEIIAYILSKGVNYGNITLTLSGKLADGLPFEGNCIIKVSALAGDVNCDGKVDIYDIIQAASSYGSREEEPNWNPNANFAQPYDRIDIIDLVTIAANYGKTHL